MLERSPRNRSRSRIDRPIIKPVSWEGVRSFLIYGRSGTGKTTLAASFPTPILLLDVGDRGTDSIADVKKIDRSEIISWDDFENMYWYLRDGREEYKTLVIDTVTQLQRLAEAKVKGVDPQDLEAENWGSMKRAQWGEVSSLMKTWLVRFRDLPMNVVFIAQDRTFNVDEESEDDNVLMPEVGAALSPAVAKTLNASVSVIGGAFIRIRTEVTKRKTKRRVTEYCLRIGPNPIYTTKIRKPKSVEVPDYIVNPTYDAIMEVIKGA